MIKRKILHTGGLMKKAALTGVTALTLLDISAAMPVAAHGADSFAGPYVGAHTGYFAGNAEFTSAPYSAP